MTEKQLKDLIKQGEGQTLEFKDDRIHPRSLAETLAAFAAADGGALFSDILERFAHPDIRIAIKPCQ